MRTRCKPGRSEATWRTPDCGESAASKVRQLVLVSSQTFWGGFVIYQGLMDVCWFPSDCLSRVEEAMCDRSNAHYALHQRDKTWFEKRKKKGDFRVKRTPYVCAEKSRNIRNKYTSPSCSGGSTHPKMEITHRIRHKRTINRLIDWSIDHFSL